MGYLLPLSIGLLALGYFLRKRVNKKSSTEIAELPTISKDIWRPLDFNTLQKQFSPGTKGRNEGSNNSPSTSSQKICATEGEILKYVKNHYNSKLREIDGFDVGKSGPDLQTVFRNSWHR